MMYVLMMIVAVSGIEAVKKESTGATFPGKQATVTSSPSMTESRPSLSVLHCGMKCLTDGDCVAANYEDAGVCHKVISTSGHFSPQDIRLQDNNLTTAILPESLPESTSTETLPESTSAADSPHMVGWWPLQEASGGKDLSGYGNNITLYGVTFEDDGATPWASPAAEFHGTAESYGHIQHGQHLDVKSFSWMAKVYLQNDASYDYLFQWKYTGGYGVEFYLNRQLLRTYIDTPGCSPHNPSHPTELPLNAWHTVAVTYDFPTNTVTLWENGESHVSTKPACGTNIETSQELYIGRTVNGGNLFDGRLSCMSLYSTVVDYDVMYNATMSHCGGE